MSDCSGFQGYQLSHSSWYITLIHIIATFYFYSEIFKSVADSVTKNSSFRQRAGLLWSPFTLYYVFLHQCVPVLDVSEEDMQNPNSGQHLKLSVIHQNNTCCFVVSPRIYARFPDS